MSFANRYAFNKEAAEDGTWVVMGGGLDIRVRRINSKFVRDFVTKENKKHSHLTRGGRELPNDISEMISRRVGAHAILNGWRDTPKGPDNPTGEKGAPRGDDGNVIEYSPDVALQYFVDYPDFLEDVVTQSSSVENFREEERKTIEGNS